MKRFLLLTAAFLTFVGSLNLFAASTPTGLLRIKNRRTSTAYLTSTASGSATGASKVNSGFSQIWICETAGDGYTLRSANTGEYLQANFAAPSSAKTTLYIQADPNASAYFNISSSSSFSGSTCMNLGNNGTTITKWNNNNDQGSMWTLESVSDVTEEDVKAHFVEQTGFTGTLEEGKYYRVISSYGLALTETEALGGDLYAADIDAANIAQYWTLFKDGNNWKFQNVLTERYLIQQTSTSVPFHTTTQANIDQFKMSVGFVVTPVADKWTYKWTINYPGDNRGLHDASTQGHNVVLWSTAADASVWSFQEAEVSQEAIDAARAKLNEYEEVVEKFNEIVKQKSALQAALNNLFQDKACSTLKEDIAALTDEQLAANESYAALTDDMKAMVLKIKNDTWKQFSSKTSDYTAGYEKFFRVADYQVYSNCDEMWKEFVMSNPFGRLSGPTGIVANKGDIIYVYVDANPDSHCTLQLEAVETDGVAGNHPTGTLYALRQGLNLFQFNEQRMLYVLHQVTPTSGIYSRLSRYKDIKVHIEGGALNGYWDATRGMTNADWALLQQDLLKASPFLNLKTKHLVFQMDTPLVLAAEPTEMEGLMRIWEQIPTNEDRYMGVEDFEGRYNNIWNVFSGASSYMHSTNRGTWYTESTISSIMNYNNMRQPGSLWGPSHEIGHNHQASINVCGTTESSNNLFSNINTFEQGIQTSRCFLPSDNFNALATAYTNNGTTYATTPWPGRDIWNTTRMFFQLYLYFHVQHHDDNFLPNLFRRLRKNPINKNSGTDNTTPFTYTEDGQTKTGTGARICYGRLDYLHLAKMICDVAEADLSEFFESYGMFVPVKNFHVGDYANYLVTTTQADIDAARKYMQKYPKKLGNIMFIDDHILPMKDANPDNIFEGLPQAGGKRVNNLIQHTTSLPVGDVGDYMDYDGHEEFDVNRDYFSLSGSTATFAGTGYIGHKFYDLDGNLIWATNCKKATLPTAVTKLGVDKYYVVAAQQNMEDVPCPYFKRGTNPVYSLDVNFGNADNVKTWYSSADTKLADYLPENAVAVLTVNDAPESLTATPNVISGENATAASIVINGDKPWYLPQDVTAASVTFTKTGAADTYAALNLPFEVKDVEGLKTASYDGQALTVTDAASVAAGQPAILKGDVALTLADVALKANSYQPLGASFVLASDANSVVAVEAATPFTYSFAEATAIRDIAGSGNAPATAPAVYDLMGRRVSHVTHGIYIINGKKVIVK